MAVVTSMYGPNWEKSALIATDYNRYHQYNNTRFLVSAVTKQTPNNSTAADGNVVGFNLAGIPTTLVPHGDLVGYGGTSFVTDDRFSWPEQSLTM